MVEFYTQEATPYGLSYGQWTVEWWRWAMSIPRSTNPVLDETGKYAHVNQPRDVWFLAGTFGRPDNYIPQRCCTVPLGKSVLIPVLNCEASLLDFPHLKTDQELVARLSEDINTVVKTHCIVNGQVLPPQRVKCEPDFFKLNVSEDLDGPDKGMQNITCVADGYWVFLKPPPSGRYEVSFLGTCENGRLNSGASYDIRVM